MPALEELPESVSRLVYRQALRVDEGIDFYVHLDRLIRKLKGFLSTVAEAFVESVKHETEAETKSQSGSISSLKQLFEALSDCHTAYLRYAADLDKAPSDFRPELLKTRPEYVESVKHLVRTIWNDRAVLQIYAPDVYDSLIRYTDSEVGYAGDEGAIAMIRMSILEQRPLALCQW